MFGHYKEYGSVQDLGNKFVILSFEGVTFRDRDESMVKSPKCSTTPFLNLLAPPNLTSFKICGHRPTHGYHDTVSQVR